MQPNAPLNVAVIGFGSQAQAWTQNLQDSGHQIQVYLRQDSTSVENVKSFNLAPKLLTDLKPNIDQIDFILLLTPDHTHDQILTSLDLPESRASIILGHGYSHWKYDFHQKYPHLDFKLLAPKSIASEIRSHFLNKSPIFAAVSDDEDARLRILAEGIGVTRLISTTFKDEAVADLFSEQALLCGMIPYLAKSCFEKLTKNGINPELAYIECWHEVKLIADVMIKNGPEGLFEMISPNALMGADFFKNQILKNDLDPALDETLETIKNRGFIDYESQNDMNVIRDNTLKYWKQSQIQEQFEKLKK